MIAILMELSNIKQIATQISMIKFFNWCNNNKKNLLREKLKGMGADLDGQRDHEKSLGAESGGSMIGGRLAQESASSGIRNIPGKGRNICKERQEEFDAFGKQKEGQGVRTW